VNASLDSSLAFLMPDLMQGLRDRNAGFTHYPAIPAQCSRDISSRTNKNDPNELHADNDPYP
jgi:hypothetical protein